MAHASLQWTPEPSIKPSTKKYQMADIDELLDNISQITTSRPHKKPRAWLSILDLRYAYGQVPLSPETSQQCNFSIVGGQATGAY